MNQKIINRLVDNIFSFRGILFLFSYLKRKLFDLFASFTVFLIYFSYVKKSKWLHEKSAECSNFLFDMINRSVIITDRIICYLKRVSCALICSVQHVWMPLFEIIMFFS